MDSFQCHVGELNLRGRISGVYDAAGNPTSLPGTPSWGSSDLGVAVPHQADDGMSAKLDVVGAGETDIVVDTGVSDTPSSLVQGRCHLTVTNSSPGEVRTVVLELSIDT